MAINLYSCIYELGLIKRFVAYHHIMKFPKILTIIIIRVCIMELLFINVGLISY